MRNALYVESRMGASRAARHVPPYARALMARYAEQMDALRAAAGGPAAPSGAQARGMRAMLDALGEFLFLGAKNTE